MEHEGTVTTQPPARNFIIKRPRLTKLLDESEARIILLVAPAGYGKTTLAREWLEGRPGVAWYSGRPAMADVAALASGLVTALASDASREELVERVEILASRDQPPETLAKAVLSAVNPTIATLVIDDCHHATGSPDSEALLAEISLHGPFRVVLISRLRPTWVTARMLVYGDVCVVEMGELAFTDEEVRTVIGNDVPTSAAVSLSEARGWPAVVGLAARQGGGGLDGNLAPGELYDFFAEDLFRRAASTVQDELLMLALGADASPEVASELFGPDHEAALSRAADHGFLWQHGGGVELHPLLRTFLLQRLRELPSRDAAALVRTTVAALSSHERWDECLSALEAFPVPDLIASVLRDSLNALLVSGRTATVGRWVELALTSQVDDPILVLAQAEMALRDRDDPRAQVLGEQAGERLGTGDDAARGHIVAARAAHFREDREAVRRNAECAYSIASSIPLQATALWIAFASASERSVSQASLILERLRGLPDERPDHALRLLIAHGLLLVNNDGDVRIAAEKCELARALLPQVRDPFLRTNFLNLFAYTMVNLVEYERALTVSDEFLEEACSSGLDFAVDHALLMRVSAFIGLRKLSAAQRTLREIADRVNQASPHVVGNSELQKARLAITAGDLTRASRLLEQEPLDSLPRAFRAEFMAYRGLVFAAVGAIDQANQAFNAAQHVGGYAGAAVLCDLGLAIVSLQRAQPDAGVRCTEAIEHAMNYGRLDSVVTAGRAFPDIVRAAATNAECVRRLTRVLSASSDIDLGRRAGLEMPRVLRRSEPLSPREHDVYELVVQGRSNKEIARTLFISESTAKVHVRHIFEKLGVHTRAEAARALVRDPAD